MLTRIILIRHGLTDYNLKKRYCGSIDTGLNKIGKAQAKDISSKLRGLKIDKVFCSDLKRSRQTAKLIFGRTNSSLVKNANLREINFGRWEGLNFQQVLNKYPVIYKNWLKDPFRAEIPEGEKMKDFTTRIQGELKKIIRENQNKTVVIVSHLGPMRIILNDYLGIKRRDFWKLKIEPKNIYVLEYAQR